MSIGAFVEKILGFCQHDIEEPKNINYLFNEMLDFAGVKSVSSFYRYAKALAISFNSEEYIICPMKRSGAGFEHLVGKQMLISRDHKHKIGKSLLDALILCE